MLGEDGVVDSAYGQGVVDTSGLQEAFDSEPGQGVRDTSCLPENADFLPVPGVTETPRLLEVNAGGVPVHPAFAEEDVVFLVCLLPESAAK